MGVLIWFSELMSFTVLVALSLWGLNVYCSDFFEVFEFVLYSVFW